ncbi:MAG TPA: hypothetical protein VFC51_17990 [Chloroflexota bacterium]|nr:hypothetical protein [Chloroflexota bacterium]
MTERSSVDNAYTAALGSVLRRRDPGALKSFLKESAERFGGAAQVREIESREPAEIEILMHRMILARPDLAVMHAASQAWLAAHGLERRSPPGTAGGRPPSDARGRPGPRRRP